MPTTNTATTTTALPMGLRSFLKRKLGKGEAGGDDTDTDGNGIPDTREVEFSGFEVVPSTNGDYTVIDIHAVYNVPSVTVLNMFERSSSAARKRFTASARPPTRTTLALVGCALIVASSAALKTSGSPGG